MIARRLEPLEPKRPAATVADTVAEAPDGAEVAPVGADDLPGYDDVHGHHSDDHDVHGHHDNDHDSDDVHGHGHHDNDDDHDHEDDRRRWTTSRTAVRAAVVVMWLVGLVVGFVAILVLAARATCSSRTGGLACGTGGTIVGLLLFAVTVGVVGVSTVTVTEARSQPRRWLIRWAVSLVLLVLVLVASRLVLGTF